MEEKKTPVSRWLTTATAGIRFGPDRKAAEAELREHIEDKTADFRRIFPDMTEEEAVDRAVSEMGDAAEIGKEMARIHKSWLGYLWVASKWVLWAAMAAACWLVLFYWSSLWPAGDHGSWLGDGGMERFVQRSFGEDWMVAAEPLPLPRPQVFGEYTFSVVQADLWTATDGEKTGGMVYLVLKGDHRRPWEDLHGWFGDHVWAEDDRGNRVMSNREHLDEFPKTWAASVQSGSRLKKGVFGERLEFIIRLPDPEAEVLTLRYDRMGAELAIPIVLKEGER